MTADARPTLWQRLKDAGIVQGAMPAPAAPQAPWFVRAMLGGAGWIGALFLLGFVGVAFAFVFRSEGAAVLVGLLACAGAFLMFRFVASNPFVAQFALALSLAGQALFVIGIGESMHWRSADVAFVAFVFEAALAALVPDFIHRVLTTWGSVTALFVALGRVDLHGLAPALTASALAWLWLEEQRWFRQDAVFRPIGYGLALGMVQMDTLLVVGTRELFGFGRTEPGPDVWAWVGRTAIVVVFSAASARLLERNDALARRSGQVALGGAVALSLLLLPAPGATSALLIVLLGFAASDLVLQGLGYAALLGFVSHYYYEMQASLLDKAEVLIVSGALLLAARAAMKRLLPAGEASAGA